MSKQSPSTQTVHSSTRTADGLCEFRNKGSDGGQFEDIEVTEIILGVGESYDVKIILPDISEDTAYDPIIVRLVTSHAQLGLRRTTGIDYKMIIMKYFRSQLMVRCEGKDDCRKIHVPYVDTHVQRTRERGQARMSYYCWQFAVH